MTEFPPRYAHAGVAQGTIFDPAVRKTRK
jgi:hypothetical protein